MAEIACILFAQCEPCQFGFGHYDPPQWHTWAGAEDVAHAAATGQPDPSSRRCNCPCAGVAEIGPAQL